MVKRSSLEIEGLPTPTLTVTVTPVETTKGCSPYATSDLSTRPSPDRELAPPRGLLHDAAPEALPTGPGSRLLRFQLGPSLPPRLQVGGAAPGPGGVGPHAARAEREAASSRRSLASPRVAPGQAACSSARGRLRRDARAPAPTPAPGGPQAADLRPLGARRLQDARRAQPRARRQRPSAPGPSPARRALQHPRGRPGRAGAAPLRARRGQGATAGPGPSLLPGGGSAPAALPLAEAAPPPRPRVPAAPRSPGPQVRTSRGRSGGGSFAGAWRGRAPAGAARPPPPRPGAASLRRAGAGGGGRGGLCTLQPRGRASAGTETQTELAGAPRTRTRPRDPPPGQGPPRAAGTRAEGAAGELRGAGKGRGGSPAPSPRPTPCGASASSANRLRERPGSRAAEQALKQKQLVEKYSPLPVFRRDSSESKPIINPEEASLPTFQGYSQQTFRNCPALEGLTKELSETGRKYWGSQEIGWASQGLGPDRSDCGLSPSRTGRCWWRWRGPQKAGPGQASTDSLPHRGPPTPPRPEPQVAATEGGASADRGCLVPARTAAAPLPAFPPEAPSLQGAGTGALLLRLGAGRPTAPHTPRPGARGPHQPAGPAGFRGSSAPPAGPPPPPPAAPPAAPSAPPPPAPCAPRRTPCSSTPPPLPPYTPPLPPDGARGPRPSGVRRGVDPGTTTRGRSSASGGEQGRTRARGALGGEPASFFDSTRRSDPSSGLKSAVGLCVLKDESLTTRRTQGPGCGLMRLYIKPPLTGTHLDQQ
ncbi:basic proline-rich protein-like isoform X1 [Canis lupus familiaris]|uniref:basic proline-rich protein-like isoform X1 n=1 Tax=Canis lupus familiaris TaxID=9615 RepID=UPI0018F7D592|nr:basic proline-rich protein-like isoform X1 [Canis lupus familiaris]